MTTRGMEWAPLLSWLRIDNSLYNRKICALRSHDSSMNCKMCSMVSSPEVLPIPHPMIRIAGLTSDLLLLEVQLIPARALNSILSPSSIKIYHNSLSLLFQTPQILLPK